MEIMTPEELTHEEYATLKFWAERVEEISSYDGSTGSATDDDSSYEVFTRICNKCVYLGEGVARKAMLIKPPGEEPRVFKYNYSPTNRFDDGLDGDEQVEHEVDVWLLHSDHMYVPEIYDCSPCHKRWLEMEYLKPIDLDDDMTLPLIPRTSLEEVEGLGRLLNISVRELLRRDHWGINADGNLKIVDMGAVYTGAASMID